MLPILQISTVFSIYSHQGFPSNGYFGSGTGRTDEKQSYGSPAEVSNDFLDEFDERDMK